MAITVYDRSPNPSARSHGSVEVLVRKTSTNGQDRKMAAIAFRTFFPNEDILQIEEEEERKAGEWTLFFDGAANSKGSGVVTIIYSPNDVPIPISRRLAFQCTNNVAEYEACIAGLREAVILNVKKLRVFGDSQLIINQINDDWKTKDQKLIPYYVYLENLIEEFNKITFSYMPRVKNQFVDALATSLQC
ncbi:uncharacterized protein LOC131254920 [Magnolia sinica]|uniref:uncharacterized protein LOC131254920 n=1 Tax=Magnolia sinica TaxID=86752 RepID=UPI00265A8151|nr:uncharacterized protein LOC131254920 [Magnolia sinica]